ncbi:MAG TPA: site-2 protease family protein [Kofleriaceae bacterium]|nr:site-2 protease family protein [Kofleriaceae bacterium]
MDLNAEQIRWILIGLFVLIVSVALHEFGHAVTAHKLGDDTPSRQGRVTLNPLAHADPIGTFLLPLVGGIYGAIGGAVGGFGWGKPVEWNPARIRRGISMSTASILVSIAGPAMNLLLAVVVASVSVVLISQGVGVGSDLHRVLYFAVVTNFVLFFFNLLPVPPLDGGHVVQAFLPYQHRKKFESYARFAPFLLLALIMIPQLRGVFFTPALWCARNLYSGLGSVVGI